MRVPVEKAAAATGIREGGREGASVEPLTIWPVTAGLLRPGSMGVSQTGETILIG
jgi:hypothetical protein